MHVGWLQKDRRRCQAVAKLPTVAQLYQNLQQFVNTLTSQTSDGKAGRLKRCQVLDGKGLRSQNSAGAAPSEVLSVYDLGVFRTG